MSPVLSIAIPTYNRSAELHRLLESIERSLGRVERRSVEVIISDNGSDDDTPQVLAHWRDRIGAGVHRHSANLGVELNLTTLLSMGRGRYFWFVGDDDRLPEDVLEWLLPLLDGGRADLVLVPAARENEPEANTALAFGLVEPWEAPLRRMLNRFGLFGVLGGLGHPVFLRSALGDFEKFVAFRSLYPHTFSLGAAFCDRPAIMVTRTGFLTPAFDPATYAVYEQRWKTEPIGAENHPMGVVRAMLELHRLGVIDGNTPPSFFKRYYNEPWAIHYVAYHELARRIFFEAWRPNEAEWTDLLNFFPLIRDERYAAIFAEIVQAYGALEAARTRMTTLVQNPPPIEFGSIDPPAPR